jgi:hypothetical protein
MSYKKYFCSFADRRMSETLHRIKKQAKNMQIYDHIIIYNEKKLDPYFYKSFKDKLKPSRGFGYWVWKPQIILQTFEKMKDGDILQYTDAGCHLNKKGVKRLNEYFELANFSETGILAFQSKVPDNPNLEKTLELIEKHWTKGDIFDYFEVREQPEIYNTEQIGATIIFVKKGRKSIEIIKKWLQVYYDDFSLADDSPSKSPNFEEFIENRHDQSILSMLVKINNVKTISSFEYWQSNFNRLDSYPIWALGDKKYKNRTINKIYNYFKRRIYKSILKDN